MSEREVLSMTSHLLASMVSLVAAAPTPAAFSDAAINGDNVRSWVTHAGGTLFVIFAVIRGALAFWRQRLTEVLILAALACVCAIFVFAPDTFQGLGGALLRVITQG